MIQFLYELHKDCSELASFLVQSRFQPVGKEWGWTRAKAGMAKAKAAVACPGNNLALCGQSCAGFVWNPCEYSQLEGSGRTAGHCQSPPTSVCPHNLPPPARTDGLCSVPYHRQPICGSPTTKKKKKKREVSKGKTTAHVIFSNK